MDCRVWYHIIKSTQSFSITEEARNEEKRSCFLSRWKLVMVCYKDKKETYFLNTIHEVKMESGPKRGREDLSGSKLSLVNDCNKYMGGVDCNDALIGNYTSMRKTYKWTIKVVIHFIEEPVLNTFILYSKQFPGKMHFMNQKMESNCLEKCASWIKKWKSSKSLLNVPVEKMGNTNPKIGQHFFAVDSTRYICHW